MSFLNILFLAGMAAVAGPILAHLLARPRFRRIPFTMMQFLEAGAQESHRRRKFRNLFLLLLRCAIVACIVLGFAGPVFQSAPETVTEHATYIVAMDDSLSLTYQDHFDQLRDRLEDTMGRWPDDARIHLIGLASGAQLLDASRDEARAFLAQQSPVVGSVEFSNLATAIQRLDERAAAATLVIASDFTPQVLDAMDGFASPLHAGSYVLVQPPQRDRIDNIALLDVQTTALGDGQLRLTALVHNADRTPRTVDIHVRSGAQEYASGTATVAPGSTVPVPLDTAGLDPDGALPLSVSLGSDDGLTADNTYYLGLRFPEKRERHVVIIGASTREAFLVRTAVDVLGTDMPHMAFTTQEMLLEQLDPSALQAAAAVILTGVDQRLAAILAPLERFLHEGGTLITFLRREQHGGTLERMYASELIPALPNRLHQTGASLAVAPGNLPATRGAHALLALDNYRLERFVFDAWYGCEHAPDAEAPWPLDSGDSLMYRRRTGAGEAILVNTSADDGLSGLTKSPAALPFFAYLLNAGESLQVDARPAGLAFGFPRARVDSTTIPEQMPVAVVTPGGARVSGHYASGSVVVPAISELGHATLALEPPAYVGLNAPSGETDLSPASEHVIADAVSHLVRAEPGARAAADSEKRAAQASLGAWFLAAALGLLLLESFLANRLVR